MNANAWSTAVTWGATATADGDAIVWGTVPDSGAVWTAAVERSAGTENASDAVLQRQRSPDDLRVRAAALPRGGSE